MYQEFFKKRKKAELRKNAEKESKSGSFPQKAEDLATLVRMTITIPISIVATNGSILDDGVFSFNSTLPHDHRLAAPNHPKTASRNRTSSATDSSQPVSTFEWL